MITGRFAAGLVLTIAYAATTQANQTLSLVERVTDEHTIHRVGTKDSLGDMLVFVNAVYAADNVSRVGRDEGHCLRVSIGKSWECSWTLMLEGGQIMSQGPVFDSGDSILAITGGTGKYAGAHGSLVLHARPGKEASYDFRYEML